MINPAFHQIAICLMSNDSHILTNDIETMLNLMVKDELDVKYDKENEYIPLQINIKYYSTQSIAVCNIMTGGTASPHIPPHGVQTEPTKTMNAVVKNPSNSRQAYIFSIRSYLSKMSCSTLSFLTSLSLTTLTIHGKLSNIIFHEEEIVDMLDLSQADNRILKIECNFGEYYHPRPYIKLAEKKRTTRHKTSRGHQRRFQGNGLCFGSQITFYIYNDEYNKTYIIKLFRGGEIQVSGIRTPNTQDVIKPLILLRNFLRREFAEENIDLMEIRPVMRNYTSRLLNEDFRFDLNALEECIMLEKSCEDNSRLKSTQGALLPDDKNEETTGLILPKIGISTIQYNTERYFAVVIKFDRPVPWKPEKKCAIKILKSGKVNFDGSNSSLECLELYCWFSMFCIKYQKKILYDSNLTNQDMFDSDAEQAKGYESIYDDEP